MDGFFLLDKVVKLVSGGSVINGAYPVYFLAAQSSSRRLVIGPLVGLLVGPLVGPSGTFVK